MCCATAYTGTWCAGVHSGASATHYGPSAIPITISILFLYAKITAAACSAAFPAGAKIHDVKRCSQHAIVVEAMIKPGCLAGLSDHAGGIIVQYPGAESWCIIMVQHSPLRTSDRNENSAYEHG